MKKELKIFAAFAGVFLVAYFLPLNSPKVKDAVLEAFKLLQWYARNHTLACVVPALFIAGGIITWACCSAGWFERERRSSWHTLLTTALARKGG